MDGSSRARGRRPERLMARTALRGVKVGSKFVGSETKGISLSRQSCSRSALGNSSSGRQITRPVCASDGVDDFDLDSRAEPGRRGVATSDTPNIPWHSGMRAMAGIPASPETGAPQASRQIVVSTLSSRWWPVSRASILLRRHARPNA